MFNSSTQVLKLKECVPGQEISCFLAVRSASAGRTNNGGKPYLSATLSDGQIDINCKQWGYEGPLPEENTVIKVHALVETYQDNLQLKILSWKPAKDGEYEPTQFLPTTPRDIEALKAELQDHIESVTDPGLKELIDRIMSEHYDRFCACPAAIAHHQNYIGGLLEHSVGVTNYAMQIAYGQNVNENLLRTGAILHDIGKIWDYSWDGCTIAITDHGRMIGHIPRGIMVIETAANECQTWDKTTLMHLKHLIASHRGKLEWGSPMEPVTKEAIILSRADVLDATIWKIAKAEAEAEPGTWTPRIYGLNKSFFVPQRDNEEVFLPQTPFEGGKLF